MAINEQYADIKSMNIEELKAWLQEKGFQAFRAKQLFDWMHVKLVDNFDLMTNLPATMKERMKKEASLTTLEVVREQISQKDGTRKYLFRLEDGNMIESVKMDYKHGLSVCISSQVGCGMACSFCASTIDGLVRNLTAAEMLEQVYRIQTIADKRVSNIVVMGSGEPLQNFDNLIRFLELINDEKGLNISLRNITISTCGLIPEIYKLAELNLPITLAISLHAPNSDLRKTIMPVEKAYPLNLLLRAAKDYFKETGRRVSFEYALMRGINDSLEEAKELAGLLKGMNAHVNIINVNPVEERKYEKSKDNTLLDFKELLEKNHINVTIRRELGQDIDGACGQLRRRYS